MTNIRALRLAPAIAAGVLATALTACGGGTDGNSSGEEGNLSGTIRVDGSSTVAPLTSVAGELFKEEEPGVRVPVGTAGTGGGFEKFCVGETDLSDASRPIEEDEAAICEENGIEYGELVVANDALTVVVNKENDWADCLTVEQLKKIWEPKSTISNWNQVDPSFPDVKLELFGPGTDSGTFDYFTDEINGAEGASRKDYSSSEDDNIIVQGVSGETGGLGYFGFTYYEENADDLTAVSVDSGDGCVAPSADTVQDGSYTPLARPLFIYPSAAALDRPEVESFVRYYVDNSATIAEEALFIPLSSEQETELKNALAELVG